MLLHPKLGLPDSKIAAWTHLPEVAVYEILSKIGTELGLSHQAYLYVCLAAGVFFAFNRAFTGVAWPKSTVATSLVNPFVSLVKDLVNKSKLDPLEYLNQLIGSSAIVLIAYLVSFIALGFIFVFFKAREGNPADLFGDFWHGGHKAIDHRSKGLQSINDNLEREILSTHQAYNRMMNVIRLFQTRRLDHDEFSEMLEVLLDRTFLKVLGEDKTFRCAVYLLHNDPTITDRLVLACSAHPSGSTPDHLNQEWMIQGSVAGKCFETGGYFRHPSKDTRKLFKPGKNAKASFAKSFACLRIEADKRKWGVLSIDWDGPSFPELTGGQVLFLRFIAGQIAETLEKSSGCGKWRSLGVK